MNDAITLAAPAPIAIDDDEPDEAASDPLHEISERWASWIRTRRFYVAPSLPPSILGKLRSGTGKGGDGPDAVCSPELAAFNEAVESQPIDALDRQVFELHYRHRVKPIKTFAQALGISRQHWYVLLRSFEQRVNGLAGDIQAKNEAARGGLRSQRANP
jgi:hypothetical protein